MRLQRPRFRLAVLALALTAGSAPAHPLAPSLLELRERDGGTVDVSWKRPVLGAPGAAPTPVLPPGCRDTSSRVDAADGAGIRTRWTMRCDASLVGARLGIDALAGTGAGALVRVVLRDGRVVQGLVDASRPLLTVPLRSAWTDVAGGYGRLGIEHIVTGPDHLLFVFGLVLLAGTRRRLLGTVTAFTLAHSVTLSLAALGLVTLPSRPIEAAIAGSIFLLAVELARDGGTPGIVARRPAAMAAVFGLLHGLGFAAALREAGLPGDDIPLALLSFNVGIELGQLAFVLAVLVARRALAGWRLPGWTVRLPVYAMGSLAAFWWIERTAALLR